MGNMRNMHRIMGSVFMHIKPNLCPFCQHYRTDPNGWEGQCVLKRKILSMPKTEKGRCKEFERKAEAGG